jgi:hypothetical protein
LPLEEVHSRLIVPSSRSPRVLSRGISLSRMGCGVPRACFVSSTREASGKTRPPATTSGTCERTNARPKSTAPLCNARRSGQGGLGANNRRGGAPRGGRPASRDVRRALRACGPTSLACEGCRASTRAPVGAPPPSHGVRRERCKARRTWASREGRGMRGRAFATRRQADEPQSAAKP